MYTFLKILVFFAQYCLQHVQSEKNYKKQIFSKIAPNFFFELLVGIVHNVVYDIT